MQLILIRPDKYNYVKLPMTDSLFWRRVENLRRAMLTAQDFEFRLIYYNQMIELMKRVTMIQVILLILVLLMFFNLKLTFIIGFVIYMMYF